jgi:hypothetical protein
VPEFLVLGSDTASAYHARQLGAAFGTAALRVVESNWQEAIRSWVERASPDDQLVPRDWDLASVIADRARELGYEPLVFRIEPYAAGVATIPAAALQAALRTRARRLLVATSSHCHGAVEALLAPLPGKLSDGP